MDVINYRAGHTSFIRDLEEGKAGGIIATILGGMACGFLWEIWNYWAISKWVYTVPWFEDAKLFEMPLLGYLGFGFFAVETIAFSISLRREGFSDPMVPSRYPLPSFVACAPSLSSSAIR